MSRKEYMVGWREKNREKLRFQALACYYRNREKILEKRKTEEYRLKRRDWCKKNKKVLLENARDWWAKNKDKKNAILREKYKTDPFYRSKKLEISKIARKKEYICGGWKREKERKIRVKYGIDFEQLVLLCSSQGNKCLVCSDNIQVGELGKRNTVHIDHCHKSDKIRGLLCGRCNQALGLLKDSPEICRSAADYLERNNDISDIVGLTRKNIAPS